MKKKTLLALVILLLLLTLLTACTEKYQVTFETNSDEGIKTIKVAEGKTIGNYIPVKKGYTFTGWYKDKELTQLWDKNDKVTEDITLFAAYEKASYTLTLDYNYENKKETRKIEYLEKLNLPELKRIDYVFLGWSYEQQSSEYIGVDAVLNEDKDLTVYAQWKSDANVTVKFIIGNVEKEETAAKNSTFDLSEITTDKYYVLSWSDSEGNTYAWNATISITKDMVLTAEVEQKTVLYSLSEDKQSYSITGLYRQFNQTKLVIPESFRGLPVTKIESYALNKGVGIEELIVGDNITTICENAFYNLQSLKNLTVPFIGGHKCHKEDANSREQTIAYWSCQEIEWPNNFVILQYYDLGKFMYGFFSSSLDTLTINGGDILQGSLMSCPFKKVIIGKDVTYIGKYSFYLSSKLTEVEFEDGINLSIIDEYAFAKAASTGISLQTISIPDSVTKIGDYAFYYADKLADVILTENSKLVSIGNGAFFNAGIKSMILPQNVEVIEGAAFANSSIESFTFNNKVHTVGRSMFSGCKLLNSVSFADNKLITEIPESMFRTCRALSHINLPDQINTLGNFCFYESGVKEFTVPSMVTVLPDLMFTYNDSLQTINIGKNVTAIGAQAFNGCKSLKNINFEDANSITYMGKSCFISCESLNSFVLSENLKEIPGYAFYSSGITSITIPAAVTTIGAGAFQDSLLKTVEFSKNSKLVSVKNMAFHRCYMLESIKLPDSVELIEHWAFADCISMTTANVPAKVSYVGQGAFHRGIECQYYIDKGIELKELTVTISAVDTSSWGSHWDGSEFDYDIEANWDCKVKVINNQSQIVNGNYTYSIVDNMAVLTGYIGKEENIIVPSEMDGMKVISFGGIYANKPFIVSVTIPDTIEAISANAFDNCANLTEIKFNENSNVKRIEDYAFKDCKSLTSLNLPASVEYIGSYINFKTWAIDETGMRIPDGIVFALNIVTFEKGSRLNKIADRAFMESTISEIMLPDSVKYIGELAFYKCENLKACPISENNSLEYIGRWAFRNNIAMTGKFHVSSTLSYIGEFAFTDSKINEITFAEKGVLKYIYQYTFGGIDIKYLNLPEYVTNIEDFAFSSCSSLTNLKFNENITYNFLGEGIFANCTGLKKVIMPKAKQVAAGIFHNCNSDILLFVLYKENELPKGWDFYWNSSLNDDDESHLQTYWYGEWSLVDGEPIINN